MMNRKTACHSLLLFLLSLSIVQVSCTPESCLEETAATVNAVFYRTGTGDAEAPDSVTLYGIGNEQNKIYNATGKLKVARIPLNASENSCSFYIKVNNITDTLFFSYSSYPHLVSKECGFTVYHAVESVSNRAEAIDVLLINGSITTSNEENIRIFY
jgi:hypothetical protein